MENGLWEHREIDDPAERELILVDEAEFLGDLGPRSAGKSDELSWIAGHEEHGVAIAETKRSPQRLDLLVAQIVRDRSDALGGARRGRLGGGCIGALSTSKHDVAEPGFALALRP